jgi:uncharacterized protein YceH (UPF0502 family)
VAGVLVEKAKTTPDAYPMSLNAIVTGCNQKSNRDPVMNVQPEQVETALEQLREMGAVAEVHSSGRVPKFRHYMYEWLGVNALEMAVMTELLLRGPQTVGELRGRASRMEPIASLGELKPILDGLIARGLVIALTPEGRGQMVTHALYLANEMERMRSEAVSRAGAPPPSEESAPAGPRSSVQADALAELRVELAELRAAFARLRDEVAQLRELLGETGATESGSEADEPE